MPTNTHVLCTTDITTDIRPVLNPMLCFCMLNCEARLLLPIPINFATSWVYCSSREGQLNVTGVGGHLFESI
ncbi:unnamed protein product, partial [Mycena citricolor]